MLHFAKLGMDNVVLEVLTVNEINSMTLEGTHDEAIGIQYLIDLTGHMIWVETSYESEFRGKFASIGFIYDSESDEFKDM